MGTVLAGLKNLAASFTRRKIPVDRDQSAAVFREKYNRFQSLLEAHARYLKASSARKVMLEGHTDDRGGREYNLALGQKRAEAVRRSLGLLGVSDAQVEAVSYGKEKPAVQGNNESAFAQNRRVELSYR